MYLVENYAAFSLTWTLQTKTGAVAQGTSHCSRCKPLGSTHPWRRGTTGTIQNRVWTWVWRSEWQSLPDWVQWQPKPWIKAPTLSGVLQCLCDKEKRNSHDFRYVGFPRLPPAEFSRAYARFCHLLHFQCRACQRLHFPGLTGDNIFPRLSSVRFLLCLPLAVYVSVLKSVNLIICQFIWQSLKWKENYWHLLWKQLYQSTSLSHKLAPVFWGSNPWKWPGSWLQQFPPHC